MIYTNAINILAIIFILLALSKFLFLLVYKKKKIKLSKKLYKNKNLLRLILLAIILIIFNYLKKEIYIKEILATSLFILSLLLLGLVTYLDDLVKIFEKEIKQKDLLKQNWISILIWLTLIILGIQEIFS